MGTIEKVFEFLLIFQILLHVLPEREHFGHIFYLNPNSRTFHEISGENIKFKEFPGLLLIFRIQGYFQDILEFQEAAGTLPCWRQPQLSAVGLASA